MGERITKAEAREKLLELGHAIETAVTILRPYADLIRRYQQEQRDMENFGHIINPTLYRSSERVATDAILSPIYGDALRLIDTFDRQLASARDALAKVHSDG